MKKITAAAACLILLTGCGTSKPAGKPITTTPPPTGTAPTQPATETTTSAGENDFDLFEYAVDPEGVTITIDGDLFQRIDLDCTGLLAYAEEINSKPDKLLQHYDFNMDGLIDLFVPTEYSFYERLGTYYRYEPGADEYVPWDTLNEMNKYFSVEEENNRIIYSDITDPFRWSAHFFKWEGDDLVPIGGQRQYDAEDEGYIREEYDVIDGEEKLTKKQQLIMDDQNKAIKQTIDLPLDEEAT